MSAQDHTQDHYIAAEYHPPESREGRHIYQSSSERSDVRDTDVSPPPLDISSSREGSMELEQHANELYQLYFQHKHPTAPILVPSRDWSNSSAQGPEHAPTCLRSIMWALASTASGKYSHNGDCHYNRARRDAQADEMCGYGERAMSLEYFQTWILISHYEIKRSSPPRAWQSIGKTIFTQLPSSEGAFENNKASKTTRLNEALKPESIESLSELGAVVVLSLLIGHSLHHFKHQDDSYREEDTDDLTETFWRSHHEVDNSLVHFELYLPERLRLPMGLERPNLFFVHMMSHTLTICIHQVAASQAERDGHIASVKSESEDRCVASALAVSRIMKMGSHTDPAAMHMFTPFCVFVAARVLAEISHRSLSNSAKAEYEQHVRFLEQALHAMKKKNPVTEVSLIQLRLMESSLKGISISKEACITSIGSDHGSPPQRLGFTPSFRLSSPRESLKTRRKCSPIFEVRDKAPTTPLEAPDGNSLLLERNDHISPETTLRTTGLLTEEHSMGASSSLVPRLFPAVHNDVMAAPANSAEAFPSPWDPFSCDQSKSNDPYPMHDATSYLTTQLTNGMFGFSPFVTQPGVMPWQGFGFDVWGQPTRGLDESRDPNYGLYEPSDSTGHAGLMPNYF
ncbi:hypothetical protein BCR34DRAFT_669301 [Clohesyomyces aquaticus]|uniref:Transcription factor domain-containing protein n=1 Tax=Clohesyomyces aquaticus TaxID=1231657 RepID=A0A1Y1YE14_9PLEO|nr:hypothetical protein BCR34DRAFT_669301 [Clohesyomyces aquaticus]